MIYKHLTTAEIPEYWLRCKEQVQSALAHNGGESNEEHYRRQIEQGKIHVFVAEKDGKVVVTMLAYFIQYQLKTALFTIAVGADEPHLFDQCYREYIPTVLEWAKRNGATIWRASVHPAMARLLRPYGFETLYHVVHKEI